MAECAEVQELLPSYWAGALTPDDLETVEIHLESCASCRVEAGELRDLVSLLRLAPQPVDPSPALRERIMTLARDETNGAGPISHPTLTVVRGGHSVRQVALHWAAIAALVPLVFSAWLAYEVVSVRRAAEAMQDSAHQAWQRAEVATEIMGRAIQVGAGTAHVDGTEMAPKAWGTLYYTPAQQDGVLVVGGLPSLPQGQCYQLWLVNGDRRTDGGTFYPEDDGKGMLIVKSPMPLASFDAIGVTMEPHGGSPEPHGNRYMWARLQKS